MNYITSVQTGQTDGNSRWGWQKGAEPFVKAS